MRALVKVMPPAEYLRECFDYEPAVGELRWKSRAQKNQVRMGEIAGWVSKEGYRRVLLDGRNYAVHRIIFKMMTGEEPLSMVDHEDGDSLNNRWLNLRAATSSQSTYNRGQNKNNTTGYRGVYRYDDRWVAKIATRYLGDFKTAEDASVAYEIAARKLFGDFYRQEVT